MLALEATNIRYGSVPAADVAVAPPASAKKVDLGSLGALRGKDKADKNQKSPDTKGLKAVQAAAGFQVTAPDQIAGMQRSLVRLVGKGDSKAVVLAYGEGLGAIAVVERPGDARSVKQLAACPEFLSTAQGPRAVDSAWDHRRVVAR